METSIIDRFNKWLQESVTVKLMSIGFLVLLLLIPSTWIQHLMHERHSRAEDVVDEISSKWSGQQSLSGPVLVIPYHYRETVIDRDKKGVEYVERKANYYLLPEKLDVKGTVKPQVLHRGIFDAAVYESQIEMRAEFARPVIDAEGINEKDVLWNEARMVFSVSDLRGISDNPVFLVGNTNLATEPTGDIGLDIPVNKWEDSESERVSGNGAGSIYLSNGIVARLGWASEKDFNGHTEITLPLKGSQQLAFIPSGKTTEVKLSGPWASPSFNGEFLPAEREISDEGFSARWKVLHYNRPFAQSWNTDHLKLAGADFGVKLLIPVDQYQKSIRTSKYSELIIILTFAALFLVEISRKIRIHPFQYILIGAALIIYYTLLISLSEQVGYNAAYWVSTLATVGLVGAYSLSFMEERRLTALLISLMLVFYAFIFVIILQQDFSLLLGSIGLFIIIGAMMYFSRTIKWYDEGREPHVKIGN
ncbi:MAG: cell envelope integrity protein CreD [Bacteroidetes bacterium]|nr:cell envelope integrity protein CreD [Bacteroidota bacterium]